MIRYEWAIELTEIEENDVVDITHADTYGQAKIVAAQYAAHLPDGYKVEIALTRLRGNEIEGLQDRQYAYIGQLEDGKLPPVFDGGARVPEKYLRECP